MPVSCLRLQQAQRFQRLSVLLVHFGIGRVGNRPYARGRAYSEKHYDE